MILDPCRLSACMEAYRRGGSRIVFTNGCFDFLHRGHITYLSHAKALGDILIVAVNSDDSVRRLKGSSRPINFLDDRHGIDIAYTTRPTSTMSNNASG